MRKISLTGIKPTGQAHIGNYIGAIKPAIDLSESGYEGYYFIANYHALTTNHKKEALLEETYSIMATWIALGLDLNKNFFYVQSDIPETFELSWILSCFAPKGLLDRAHAFKDAQSKSKNLNIGLYTYPVLMAADILLFEADVVPVGKDQKQHVEIARDIADKFNNTYGNIIKLPEPLIKENTMAIPGLDGQKMSKSYNNTIPIFDTAKKTQKLINKIVTDSTPLEDPKDPSKCTIMEIYKTFASSDEVKALEKKYTAGGMGWGEAKKILGEKIISTFEEPKKEYDKLMTDKAYLREVANKHLEKAREKAATTLDKVRNAIGII